LRALPETEDDRAPFELSRSVLAFAELARRAKERPHRDAASSTRHLVDMVTAVLVYSRRPDKPKR